MSFSKLDISIEAEIWAFKNSKIFFNPLQVISDALIEFEFFLRSKWALTWEVLTSYSYFKWVFPQISLKSHKKAGAGPIQVPKTRSAGPCNYGAIQRVAFVKFVSLYHTREIWTGRILSDDLRICPFTIECIGPHTIACLQGVSPACAFKPTWECGKAISICKYTKPLDGLGQELLNERHIIDYKGQLGKSSPSLSITCVSIDVSGGREIQVWWQFTTRPIWCALT